MNERARWSNAFVEATITLATVLFASVLLMGAFATAAFAESGGQGLRGAEIASQSASDLDCTPLMGSNVNAQNYDSYFANPVYSYLVKSENGYMRVQGNVTDQGVVVAYYDNDFVLQSRQVIPVELPLFGGFYEAADHYYIVTGQTNAEEDNSVEVFRVTKYDKDWNRIGSCGLYGANTVDPFAAGSCRMTEASGRLVIRTCHRMYQDANGVNHQANVTMLVDTQSMSITDSFASVMNKSYGYVSHSFNQFVKLEDNKIVSVDHGDSRPRSICLMKYPTNVTTGQFVSDNVQVIDVMPFAGNTGNNYTGASVGAFEISSSSYLIAGNSVIQDEQFSSRRTRNVFVAAVNKATNEVTVNWLTDYQENGSAATTTPQMVQVSNNQYLVLWSVGKDVYYVLVDDSGQTISETYSMQGSLSDCVPVVDDGKVIWYTWENGSEAFYIIPLDTPSSASVSDAMYDHDYQLTKTENGLATLTCAKCGEEKTGKVPTAFDVFWLEGPSSIGTYYWYTPSGLEVDSTVWWTCDFIQYSAESDTTFAEFSAESNDPEHCFVDAKAKKVTFSDVGTYTVIIYPTYNPSLRKTATIKVTKPLESVVLSSDRPSPQQFSSTIMLTASANGGKGTLTYAFTITGPNGEQTVASANSGKSNYLRWQPGSVGDYTIRAEVTDAGDGNKVVASNELSYTIERANVRVADGKRIRAKENLVYGQGLSDLSVENASFMAAGSNTSVTGTLSFESPDAVLDAGTHEVIWTFTPDNANYYPAGGSFTVTVDKATLTVKYEGERIEWNGEPELKVTVEGFVGDDTEENSAGYVAPKVIRPDTLVPGGSYTLVPAGGEARNYDFDYSDAAGVLVVGEKPQWVLVGERIDALGALPADATVEQQDAYIAGVRAVKAAYESLSEADRANLAEKWPTLVSAEESAFGVLIDRAKTQADSDRAAAFDEEMLQEVDTLRQAADGAVEIAQDSNNAAQKEGLTAIEQLVASKQALADSADAQGKATAYKQAADAAKEKADAASGSARAFSELVAALQSESPECDFSTQAVEAAEAVANAESRAGAAAAEAEAAGRTSVSADTAFTVANTCEETAVTRAVREIDASKGAADADAQDASDKRTIADNAREAAATARTKAEASYAAAQSDQLEGKTAEEKLVLAQQAVADAADAKSAADDAKAAADAYEASAKKAHESADAYKQLVEGVKGVDDALVSEDVMSAAATMEQVAAQTASGAGQAAGAAAGVAADADTALGSANATMAEIGPAVADEMIGAVNSAIDATKIAQNDANAAKSVAVAAQQQADRSANVARDTAGKTAEQQLSEAKQAADDAATAKAAAQAYQEKARAAQEAAAEANKLASLLASVNSYATPEQQAAISSAATNASSQSIAVGATIAEAEAYAIVAEAYESQASAQVTAAKEAVKKAEEAQKAEQAQKAPAKKSGSIIVKAKKKTLTIKAGKSLKASKAFKVTQNLSGGKVTYKLVKVPKASKKYIKVAKSGKITVKKGIKKGKTYTIQVKATSAATANYNAATSKTFKVKIKVK